jgi:hypothetical protein
MQVPLSTPLLHPRSIATRANFVSERNDETENGPGVATGMMHGVI